jgi:hypothetical protein
MVGFPGNTSRSSSGTKLADTLFSAFLLLLQVTKEEEKEIGTKIACMAWPESNRVVSSAVFIVMDRNSGMIRRSAPAAPYQAFKRTNSAS